MAALEGRLLLSRCTVTEVVSDPDTPKVHLVAGTAGGVGGGGAKVDQIQQSGGFRQYGNGNIRLILGSAQGRNQTLALRALTPSQVEAITGLLGRTIVYRDPYGRRIFGAFLELSVNTIPFSGTPEDGTLLADIGLTIQSVTFNEVV